MKKALFVLLVAIAGISPVAGQANPSAEEILRKVADTYRSAKKYMFVVQATVQTPDLGAPKSFRATYAIELPDKMRMEGDLTSLGVTRFSGPASFVSDGDATWVYNAATKEYYKTVRSSPKGSLGTPEGEYPDLDRPEQIVAYFNQFATARLHALLDQTDNLKITGIETISVEGRAVRCHVIQSDHGDFSHSKAASNRETIWIEVGRPRIWREDSVTWLQNGLQEHTKTDYMSVLIDEPLPKDLFVFRPPKDAVLTPIPKD